MSKNVEMMNGQQDHSLDARIELVTKRVSDRHHSLKRAVNSQETSEIRRQ